MRASVVLLAVLGAAAPPPETPAPWGADRHPTDAPKRRVENVTAGRLAYVWSGAKYLRAERVKTKIRVDDNAWFDGKAGCVLIGNVSKVFGGPMAVEQSNGYYFAKPEDL